MLTLLGCTEIAEHSERVWEEVDDEPAIRKLICLADYEDGNYVLLDTRKKAGSIVDGFCEELLYWGGRRADHRRFVHGFR